MNAGEPPRRRLFLLVDAEVVASATRGESSIKCVQAHYEAADYVAKNTRLGGG